jgi:hypothetical protein
MADDFSTLTAADLEHLLGSWISAELAETARIYRVDGYRGAEMVGQKPSAAYADKFSGLCSRTSPLALHLPAAIA